jgi:hypothetical protein
MNVSQFKAELSGILHGTTLNQITNINGLIYRSAREVVNDIDSNETKRIVSLASPLYYQVYDYVLPSDVKGNRIIDIRPQVSRTPDNFFIQRYNREFDRIKIATPERNFTVNYNSGVKTVRINNPYNQNNVTISNASSTTSDGTWSTTGTASNLQSDYVNFVKYSSSLSFDLGSGVNPSTGSLEVSLLQDINLLQYVLQGRFFYYVYLPIASNFTSIEVEVGSDSSNYWSYLSTSNTFGNAFVNGWNMLGFNWSDASVSGFPDASDISYIKVSYNYNGTQMNGVKLNNIFFSLGAIYEIEYYSKFLFRDYSTNAFQETVTDDSNLIILDTDSYNILLAQAALQCVQQQQSGSSLQADIQFFSEMYKSSVNNYKNMYPSETQKTTARYYDQQNKGYSPASYYRAFR